MCCTKVFDHVLVKVGNVPIRGVAALGASEGYCSYNIRSDKVVYREVAVMRSGLRAEKVGQIPWGSEDMGGRASARCLFWIGRARIV